MVIIRYNCLIVTYLFNSQLNAADVSEKKVATDSESVPPLEQYFNDTLQVNTTSMEVSVESPLPTHVNEIDKIIRAGECL
jgi:hypothetical protein